MHRLWQAALSVSAEEVAAPAQRQQAAGAQHYSASPLVRAHHELPLMWQAVRTSLTSCQRRFARSECCLVAAQRFWLAPGAEGKDEAARGEDEAAGGEGSEAGRAGGADRHRRPSEVSERAGLLGRGGLGCARSAASSLLCLFMSTARLHVVVERSTRCLTSLSRCDHANAHCILTDCAP